MLEADSQSIAPCQMECDMSEQFLAGETVHLVRRLSLRHAADGEFTIVRPAAR
jgi:hypothetical protein